MNRKTLRHQTLAFRGTGGISAENEAQGFRPAFLDQATGVIHVARFADGRPASVHILDGLPESLVMARDASGRPLLVKASVTAGFLRDGRFYTREEAASAAAPKGSRRSSRSAA